MQTNVFRETMRRLSSRYQTDPVAYAYDILHVRLTPEQEEGCHRMLTPPYKVLFPSSNNVGKSFLAQVLASWFYDSFDPGVCMITAPKYDTVEQVIFGGLRTIRPHKGGFAPKAPMLSDSEHHYVYGFTTNNEESFKGRHNTHQMFIFDEAIGLPSWAFTALSSMFQHTGKHFALAFYNPTSTSSPVFFEEQSGQWHTVRMSALNHPNVLAGLAGRPQPYESAINFQTIVDRIERECEPIDVGLIDPNRDFEFAGVWYRPVSPEFEVQVMGRYPHQAINSLWSEADWQRMLTPIPLNDRWDFRHSQIGCDVARFGNDSTAIHARRGSCSVMHEATKGIDTRQTANRLKEVCHAIDPVHPKKVPVAIDESGVGGGVIDQANGYNFIGVNSSRSHDRYPNIRSALWFNLVDLAREGLVDLTRIPERTLEDIRRELMSPTYRLDLQGRRVVEPKDATKGRLKRSPDNADAINLAYMVF